MKISKIPGLGRFGIFVDDVDFDHITDEEWMEIGYLHINNLVTIIRNTNATLEQYNDRISQIGSQRATLKNSLITKYKKTMGELYQMMEQNDPTLEESDRNMLIGAGHIGIGIGSLHKVQDGFNEKGIPNGAFPAGELGWHSNEPGHLAAVPGVALYGQRGMVGSATGFCTTVDWYESQSESFRSELDDMILIHNFRPDRFLQGLTNKMALDLVGGTATPVGGSEVPLVIQSPGGIKGLHYSYTTVSGIKGMSQTESQRIFDIFDQGIFQDKYTYDHWYQQDNDMLLFDNSITAHRRIGKNQNRMAVRVTFDYTNLQNKFYQPYINHGKIARQYIRDIKQQINNGNAVNFHAPTMIDYLRTFL
jgi:alpha-ketoglutarate-dependent taurine dioxygenase